VNTPDKNPSSTDDIAPWTHYWASGALHSCSNAFDGNYDDEVRSYWTDFFSRLPEAARALDIGTGNGAVAFLAQEVGRQSGRKFSIEGIDAAIIDPSSAAAKFGLAMGNLVLRGLVRSEKTDYPPQYFDAVSSQYAIEYTSVSETLEELARILKPGAIAGFVIHHSESQSVQTTLAELKVFSFLRHEVPLLTLSRRLLRKPVSGGSGTLVLFARDRESEKERKEFDRQMNRVVAYVRQRPQAAFVDGSVAQVANVLRQTQDIGPAAAIARLDILESEMLAHQARLHAIAKAACDRQGIEKFCEMASSAGFSVQQPRELRRQGKTLLGWTVDASRAS
jgi:SAM-dependent methyltransferase